ncbi:MAG: cytochrome c biogenesis protein ResB [Lachnospiraceae bacterium]|nr:cytochrome c biogenesis protein ResB [Lachnospiraceae bacterium]
MKQLKKAGKFLCSMKFAIILLVVLALACTVGSVIPQGESASWYTANYSQQMAGAVMLFGLDDIFHCWWFIVLTLFLCLNLLCCNILHFPKLIRRMKQGFTPAKSISGWDGKVAAETKRDPEKLFAKMGFRNVLSGRLAVCRIAGEDAGAEAAAGPGQNVGAGVAEVDQDAGTAVAWSSQTAGAEAAVRMEQNTGAGEAVRSGQTAGAEAAGPRQELEVRYAVKNKIGIWGAWLCHFGMLVIIAGFGLGQMLKTEYTVYGVPGQTKPIGDTGYELTIDAFEVKLREDATVDQYTSALTVTDSQTGRKESGEASVNAPLSLFGMKLYQNSTGWAASLDVYKDGEKLQEELLCAGEYAAVKDMEGLAVVLNAFYPDFYEDESGQPMTLSPYLKNPGYLYSIYYHDKIVGMNVLTGNDKITVEDYEFVFHDPQQYTLIQAKRDPFSLLAAAGGVMVLFSLILAFYVHPRELWAVRDGDGIWHIGGKSRKAGTMYLEEIKNAWAELEKEETKDGK